MSKRTFHIYRYDPDTDAKPRMQTIEVELDGSERMLLDALMKLKAVDPSGGNLTVLGSGYSVASVVQRTSHRATFSTSKHSRSLLAISHSLDSKLSKSQTTPTQSRTLSSQPNATANSKSSPTLAGHAS